VGISKDEEFEAVIAGAVPYEDPVGPTAEVALEMG